MTNATESPAEFLTARLAEDHGVREVLDELPFDFHAERLDDRTVRVLATLYADHPEYHEEWRP